MSRPPTVVIMRQVPGYKALLRHFKKERDADKVRCLHDIVLMHKLGNVEQVADLCVVSPNTVRRWVAAFNEGGLARLYKKKVPDDAPS